MLARRPDPASLQLPSLLLAISKVRASALGYNYGPPWGRKKSQRSAPGQVGRGHSAARALDGCTLAPGDQPEDRATPSARHGP